MLIGAGPTVAHWLAPSPSAAWIGQADALGLQFAGPLRAQASQQQVQVVSVGIAVAPIYLNPLRNVSDLVPERIDQGVDFSGSGPVYALGDAVVLEATGADGGWPGGGWITYQLTDGPDAGLVVYLAEDVTPTVVTGQHVSPSTVIGEMFQAATASRPDGRSRAGPTRNRSSPKPGASARSARSRPRSDPLRRVLESLGVTAAPNAGDPASGLLPANYPAAS